MLSLKWRRSTTSTVIFWLPHLIPEHADPSELLVFSSITSEVELRTRYLVLDSLAPGRFELLHRRAVLL